MKVNKGDKISITFSPHIYKVVHVMDETVEARNLNTRRMAIFMKDDILSVVERAKTTEDYRRLAEEGGR